MRRMKFRTVVLDVDSTLSGIEGIEWLAGLRGPEVLTSVNAVTEQAMRGEVEFDGVFAARLDAVRPTLDEVTRLGAVYIDNISPGAFDAVQRMHGDGLKVVIVSGGIRNAVLKLADHVGISEADVRAVPLFFDESGQYAGYDTDHPCTRQKGKGRVIESLKLEAPVLLIGDGMTDAEAKSVVDTFAAFTGAVRRESIVKLADFELTSFADLFKHMTS